MGTEGEGLLRIGKNGRHLIYNKAKGNLTSDTVKDLSSEAGSNTLFILDGNGVVHSFSSTKGFSKIEGFNEQVLSISVAGDGSKHYAATATALFSFTSEEAPSLVKSLPVPVQEIVPGKDGSLWLIAGEGVIEVDKNGNIGDLIGDFPASVSNSIPFNFETSTVVKNNEKGTASFPWTILITGVLLAFGAGLFTGWFRHRPREKSAGSLVSDIYQKQKSTDTQQTVAPKQTESPAPPIQTPAAPVTPAERSDEPRKSIDKTEPEKSIDSTDSTENPATAIVESPVKPAEKAAALPVNGQEETLKKKPVKASASNKDRQKFDYKEFNDKLKASDFGTELLKLIETNMENPDFGVEEIADLMGLSRIHVNRKLKQETGFSPSYVLKTIRMNQATHLLTDGEHTIAEVGTICGFASASYFSTAFKDYYGMTPSEYLSSRQEILGTLPFQEK